MLVAYLFIIVLILDLAFLFRFRLVSLSFKTIFVACQRIKSKNQLRVLIIDSMILILFYYYLFIIYLFIIIIFNHSATIRCNSLQQSVTSTCPQSVATTCDNPFQRFAGLNQQIRRQRGLSIVFVRCRLY